MASVKSSHYLMAKVSVFILTDFWSSDNSDNARRGSSFPGPGGSVMRRKTDTPLPGRQ